MGPTHTQLAMPIRVHGELTLARSIVSKASLRSRSLRSTAVSDAPATLDQLHVLYKTCQTTHRHLHCLYWLQPDSIVVSATRFFVLDVGDEAYLII